jgi:cAMP phosphodiesterase
MNNKTQFYFSVEKLENLLNEFKNLRSLSPEKKILRGFVFTPGEDSVSAQPLYSDKPAPAVIEEGHFLMTESNSHPGCPYPPPCN